jgi:hypothetical protein
MVQGSGREYPLAVTARMRVTARCDSLGPSDDRATGVSDFSSFFVNWGFASPNKHPTSPGIRKKWDTQLQLFDYPTTHFASLDVPSTDFHHWLCRAKFARTICSCHLAPLPRQQGDVIVLPHNGEDFFSFRPLRDL